MTYACMKMIFACMKMIFACMKMKYFGNKTLMHGMNSHLDPDATVHVYDEEIQVKYRTLRVQM